MKYIIEVESEREIKEAVFDCEKDCQKENCPFWTDTGDSFIDGCTIAFKIPKKVVIKKE